MILKIRIDDQLHSLDVPDHILTEATDFFAKMDADMDKGWQMSQQWVDELNSEQRCQVAANKILVALDQENARMMVMMAAYILYKLPNLQLLDISTNGDMQETYFEYK